MNKFLLIIGFCILVLNTINMIHYQWEAFKLIFTLLFWAWIFWSSLLEELDRIFNNKK